MMGEPQFTTEATVPKQAPPLGIRLDPDTEERLDALVKALNEKSPKPKSRHAVAAACLRLGVEVVEKDADRLYDALEAAEEAKSAAALAARKAALAEERQAATKPRRTRRQ